MTTERFIEDLKSKYPNVRARAASSLGSTKDERAVEALIEALDDDDKTVQWNAAGALNKITGENFGIFAFKWWKWWKEEKGEYAN